MLCHEAKMSTGFPFESQVVQFNDNEFRYTAIETRINMSFQLEEKIYDLFSMIECLERGFKAELMQRSQSC